MRALLIAVVLVAGFGTAEARRGGGGIVIINTGDDIIHLRNLNGEDAAALGYTQLGYRHSRFGLFWFDLWRWDGEFVVYDGNTYAPIDEELLDSLGGASVPWRYRFPDGLLIVLAVIELVIISRTRRKVKTTFIIAGVLAAISIAFFFMGLTWEFMIPLALALHHALSAYSAMKRAPEPEAVVEEEAPPARPSQRRIAVTESSGSYATTTTGRHSRPPATESSGARKAIDSGNYAAIPAAMTESRPSQPIVIQRAATDPHVIPTRKDDSVDGPKFLR